MNLLKNIILITSLLFSSVVFSQVKGKEYGVLKNGNVVEISHRRNVNNTIDFLYKKSKPGFYTVHYNFTNVRNTDCEGSIKKVIKYDKGVLFQLRPNDPRKGISYEGSYKILKGIINPKIDEKITYFLAVKKNETIEVTDIGIASEKYFNDNKPKTSKSYKIKKTTPDVFAMRKGVVITIKNKFSSKTSKITIEHEDGTFAVYKGFSSNLLNIKLNQIVKPGEKLGSLKALENNKLYQLSFHVNYRIKENNKYGKVFLEPNFLTTEGVVKLKAGKTYISTYNEEVFFQEFTRKEKKKYLKAKAAL